MFAQACRCNRPMEGEIGPLPEELRHLRTPDA